MVVILLLAAGAGVDGVVVGRAVGGAGGGESVAGHYCGGALVVVVHAEARHI